MPIRALPAALHRLSAILGFAIYHSSSDRYEDSHLPTGAPAGTPEQALDTTCGLYLDDPTAWLIDQPPQD